MPDPCSLIPVPSVPRLNCPNVLPDFVKYSILSLSIKITPGTLADASGVGNTDESATVIVLKKQFYFY